MCEKSISTYNNNVVLIILYIIPVKITTVCYSEQPASGEDSDDSLEYNSGDTESDIEVEDLDENCCDLQQIKDTKHKKRVSIEFIDSCC